MVITKGEAIPIYKQNEGHGSVINPLIPRRKMATEGTTNRSSWAGKLNEGMSKASPNSGNLKRVDRRTPKSSKTAAYESVSTLPTLPGDEIGLSIFGNFDKSHEEEILGSAADPNPSSSAAVDQANAFGGDVVIPEHEGFPPSTSSVSEQKKKVASAKTALLWEAEENLPNFDLYESARPFPCGLANVGNTCYFNVTLQALAQCPDFSAFLFQLLAPSEGPTSRAGCLAELQKIVGKILFGPSLGFSPIDAADSLGLTRYEQGRQIVGEEEDVGEFLLLFVGRLESAVDEVKNVSEKEKERAKKELRALFYGEAEQVLRLYPKSADGVALEENSRVSSRNKEVVSSLILPCESGDVEKALKDYQEEIISDYTEDGQLYDAKKLTYFKTLPKVLPIIVQRITYDIMAGTARKSNRAFFFPESLILTDGRLLALREDEPTAGRTIYDLRAIIVHGGESAGSGHYYGFVRINDTWWKVNDLRVFPVDYAVALSEAMGGDEARCSASALFYEQRLGDDSIRLDSFSAGLRKYLQDDALVAHDKMKKLFRATLDKWIDVELLTATAIDVQRRPQAVLPSNVASLLVGSPGLMLIGGDQSSGTRGIMRAFIRDECLSFDTYVSIVTAESQEIPAVKEALLCPEAKAIRDLLASLGMPTLYKEVTPAKDDAARMPFEGKPRLRAVAVFKAALYAMAKSMGHYIERKTMSCLSWIDKAYIAFRKLNIMLASFFPGSYAVEGLLYEMVKRMMESRYFPKIRRPSAMSMEFTHFADAVDFFEIFNAIAPRSENRMPWFDTIMKAKPILERIRVPAREMEKVQMKLDHARTIGPYQPENFANEWLRDVEDGRDEGSSMSFEDVRQLLTTQWELFNETIADEGNAVIVEDGWTPVGRR